MNRWIYASSFVLAALGILTPLWPLSVVGILIAVLSGRWLFGVGVALLLDVAWGAPTGPWGFFFFPFTALALLLGLLRIWGARYFLDKTPPERL